MLAVVVGLVAVSGLREELVEATLLSPELVGGQRKEEWLGMFTEGAVVEDPVGGTRSGSREELGRFWDMFISGKAIELIPEYAEIVDVANRIVLRTLNIQTTLYGGSVLNVPLHVLYEFEAATEGGLQLSKLQAFWDASESAPVSTSFTEMPSFVIGSLHALKQIYNAAGLSYLNDYLISISLHNCGPKGRAVVEDLENAVFSPTAVISQPLKGTETPPTPALLKHDIFNVHSAGRFVSFSIKSSSAREDEDAAEGALPKAGVGFVEFNSPSDLVIERVTLYLV